MTTTAVAQAPAGVVSPRYRAISIGLLALVTLQAFEAMAVTTAMPVVARELAGMSLYNLAFSASLAASVIATVLGGRWSDVRGPMPPIAAGVVVFVAGLLMAGLAPTMEVLVTGRFVQGFGTGLSQVALSVLVARAYPAALHPRVFALFSAAWVVPSMVGPAIAGLVAEQLGWRWIFLGVIAAVLPAALLLWRGASGRALPDVAVPPAPGIGRKLGWAALTAASAAFIQYGSALGVTGLPLLVAGVVLLAVALPRLLPAGAMRAARGLPTAPLLRGLAFGAYTASEVLIPLMLRDARGLSAAGAGVVLTVGALGWVVGSWLKGREAVSDMTAIRGGAALIALGVALVTLVLVDAVPLAVAYAGMAVAGLGIGGLHPTVTVLVLRMSRTGEEGRNSADVGVGESVFTVVAVAASGALFTAAAQNHAVGLAVPVVLAVVGAVLAPRFVQSSATGTMERTAS
ncbi:Major Facilitator Superfamily protein [Nonomuraea maritima]|uniref:Major Facilitator Superfamily protein n=1 Tax=Nonomuraea maritima TaxID=683260 RepID=A0A1G9SGF1_9ACTN|nr:MFS transporter [Nonomuraea maritima]SDM34519.1 Major Facilitator Superfamily protein [Nonomuraea maritima]